MENDKNDKYDKNDKKNKKDEKDKKDKKARVFFITDDDFKWLAMADKKNLNPTVGLSNLISMYQSLVGPVDFHHFDQLKAKQKAIELGLLKENPSHSN
jgi:hypothetical protein